ncbi:CASP-like protein 2C1 [Aristolochia californica]|uniref:CASP-like protein 2C1 n=1 Tax=Aristolochia californica TaxID=171875 RepID=UPI0035DAA71C
MENVIFRTEALLRLLALISAVLAACLVALEKQTKKVFLSVEKTATYKELRALEVVVIVEAVVAGYHLVQLVKCLICTKVGTISSCCKLRSHWVRFLLDQVAAYMSLGGTAAAAQACVFAVTGLEAFQWTKLCNIYTRFCYTIAGGLFCGLVASLFTAAVASISAFHLFRLFSPNKWFALKPGQMVQAPCCHVC